MSEAFDAACKALHDVGQPENVQEVMACRNFAAARKGERKLTKLPDAALWQRQPNVSAAEGSAAHIPRPCSALAHCGDAASEASQSACAHP
jgi:hypothetical protein